MDNQEQIQSKIQILQSRISGLQQLQREICRLQTALEQERTEQAGCLKTIPAEGRSRAADDYIAVMEDLLQGLDYREACRGLETAEYAIGQMIAENACGLADLCRSWIRNESARNTMK